MKTVVKISLLSVLILTSYGLTFAIQGLEGRRRPQALLQDEALIKLESEYMKLPLAKEIKDRLNPSPENAAKVAKFKTSLEKYYQEHPNSPKALAILGDLAFEHEINLPQATVYYVDSLKAKQTVPVMLKLASVLTLQGQNESAVKVLLEALKLEPNNFNANAYLSIAYSQLGRIEEAKIFGQKALSVAPSEEAEARFSSFLATLSGPKSVEDDIRGLPVVGDQVISVKRDANSVVTVAMRDFSLDKMPEFAKEKFKNRLHTLKSKHNLLRIALVDSSNQEIMVVD